MPISRRVGKERREKDGEGGGLRSTLLWVGGLVFAWAAIELAFKSWLKAGRATIRKSLDPDYDVDDELDNRNRDASSAPPQSDEGSAEPKKSAPIDDDPTH